MGAAGRTLMVEMPPAASPPSASFFGQRPGALGREFLVKRTIGRVVLVGPQGVHKQKPFFRGQAQACPRRTIYKKGRI